MANIVKVSVRSFFVLILFFTNSGCTNITQAKSLHNMLFTDYNRHMFPLLNLNDTIVVKVYVAVIGINKFDEINGQIDITCVFIMSWTDERLKWTPSEYGGKTSLLIPTDDLWYPMLYLIQSFESIQIIGRASKLIRLYYNGTVFWTPPNVLKVICSVDVTYFPFDTQECVLSVSTWAYTKDEMRFEISRTDLDLSHLSSNSKWDIEYGSLSYTPDLKQPYDVIEVKLRMHRKYEFYVVYVICPLFFLGGTNSLVFVMPASSGERTSVAITVFLSFFVFMEIVNSNVPESSSPMAYIYYYMFFMLIYSSVVLCLCVISLRIYDKDETVPPKVVKLIKFLMFWRMKKPISPTEDVGNGNDQGGSENADFNNKAIVLSDTREITWKIVGKTFDKYSCGILSVVYIVYTLVFVCRLYTNTVHGP